MEAEDFYFAQTTPGLEWIAEEEIRELLQELGNICGAKIKAFVESNFLSGQLYFSCSSLISPRLIVARLQTVEKIIASIGHFSPIPDGEEGLELILHFSYHWDDERFERACQLWKECRGLGIKADFEEKDFNFHPKLSSCCCSKCIFRPSAISPFRVNQSISYVVGDKFDMDDINTTGSDSKGDDGTIDGSGIPILPDVIVVDGEKFPLTDPKGHISDIDAKIEEIEEERVHDTPTFRVTCQRDGKKPWFY